MLGLYLDTIITGQKRCNMLSILKELTNSMQKELQNFVKNYVFLDKKK